MPSDTIAAIATAPGSGGIGIVRVSGEAAGAIARVLLGRAPRPRHAHYATFRDSAGECIDDGLLLWFPAPASYTGEDVLELQAHGSTPLLAALLARVLQLGARMARAGEFTERAYRNGRLDLAQAEAVADLIAAGSEAAARAALRSLHGDFSRHVESLRVGLLALRVQVEAAIDFPDEELELAGAERLRTDLDGLRQKLAELLAASRRGQRLRDGLHAVILGPPNAGKSSLLNALAGSERAIVTAIPGTTRDLLHASVTLDGVELTVVDTAGLRAESDDPIEREGIRRAQAERARADLVLAVIEDGDSQAEAALRAELAEAPAVLWLHNKIDRADTRARVERRDDGEHLWLSVATGDGLAPLIESLKRAAGAEVAAGGGFSARARHVDALLRASHHLDGAAAQAQAGALELLAEDLRAANAALGEITGAVSSDALLGEIFRGFCIGK